MPGGKWTPEQDEKITGMALDFLPAEIGMTLTPPRSERAVYLRLLFLGIPRKEPPTERTLPDRAVFEDDPKAVRQCAKFNDANAYRFGLSHA